MANPGAASTSTIHPSQLSTNQAIRLLAYGANVSLNATGDAAVLSINNSSSFAVTNVIITNANKDVSAGYLALWTGPAGTGTEIVTNAALTSNTSSAFVTRSTVVSGTLTTNLSTPNVYVKVGTAVSGGTVNVYVYGYDFSTF